MNAWIAFAALLLLAATAPAEYAPVNGLKMYYEIHGSPRAKQPPLVLLHGGGSTIESSFGRILPELAKSRQIITVELQAHGHTKDIDRPLSFEQDADDVAELLKQLKIEKADFLGFSNGGTTCLQIAIRHGRIVDKLIIASGAYKRDGFIAGFFDGFKGTTLKTMPPPLQEAYFKANPGDSEGLQKMFDRDVARMKAFKDIPDEQIKTIAAPTLIINADKDVVTVEHALEMSRTLQRAELAILPGGHGDYIGEICSPEPDSRIPPLVSEMIVEFLEK
jgi:pimeloyl-ACP methyl ester carboxylesterase